MPGLHLFLDVARDVLDVVLGAFAFQLLANATIKLVGME